ncbi:MAG: glycosyltransferase family 2 protein [Dehalococcoidia bacterium]
MNPGLVIVTYRCRDDALRCLESVKLHLPELLASTVVIDNASGDTTAVAVREAFPAVTMVENERNVGFAAAANQGIAALPDKQVVALLNPDTVILDAHLANAAAFMEQVTNVGVVGVRIENRDGTLQPSCRQFPSHLTAVFNRHSLLTKLIPGNRWSSRYLMTDWSHAEVRDVDWVAFSCALIHRRSLDSVGVLDEGYFFSIEDVDYCRRVQDAGLRVVYFPTARVQHRVGGSSRSNVYRAIRAHHSGMWRYYRKFNERNLVIDTMTAGGIGARLAVHALSYTVRSTFNRVFGRPNR